MRIPKTPFRAPDDRKNLTIKDQKKKEPTKFHGSKNCGNKAAD